MLQSLFQFLNGIYRLKITLKQHCFWYKIFKYSIPQDEYDFRLNALKQHYFWYKILKYSVPQEKYDFRLNVSVTISISKRNLPSENHFKETLFWLELVSKELNHFGVIADLFRQIGGHSSRFVLFCSF